MEINGIILINKQRGISSNAVVNKVKYLLKANKAGHLGTLDVLGEGLLPVTLGKGTKLFDIFLTKDKVYKTIFKFGETTATLDLEGEVIKRDDKIITTEMLKQVLPEFIGKQMQMPPDYSAKKINGKKAYQLARAGENIVLKPKEIEIYSIKLLGQIEKNTFEFLVHCSSGTFIRALCRDIAQRLNTYGVMSYIQRTKCGIFEIKDAYSIDNIIAGNYDIINLDTVFDYPNLLIEKHIAEKLFNGLSVKSSYDDGFYRLYQDNLFLGIGKVKDSLLKFDLRLI